MAAVETMGTPFKPITTAGELIGGIWAMFGVMLFWGTIVASVTVYFARRKEGTLKQIVSTVEYNLERLDDLSLEELELLKETTEKQIVSTVEYNLERLDDLSLEELELLKETTDRLIDVQIKKREEVG